ncbi:MAG: sensor histidine kinase [Ferruginibacter sp.]
MEKVIQVIIVTLFIFLMISFVILFIILYQKRHTNYLKEKQLLQSKFQQEILQAQVEIQEQTLKKISQEIHDNIGQVLSLAKLNLNTFPPTDDENIRNKLEHTRQLVSKAIVDLRDLSRSMHGDRIAEMGLKNAIENELDIIKNTGQYETTLTVTGEYYKLGQQKEMLLFRILQEALNNSIKHAKTKNIAVQLNYAPSKFSLSIRDEGPGFDLQAAGLSTMGLGLKNMQNRVAMIGGLFSLNSSRELGTTISIDLPTTITG